MIPTNTILTETLMVDAQPSKTYYMDTENKNIHGLIERNQEAVRQAVYKILNTQRYSCVIYSWNYGIDLADLFGMPVDYVCSELQNRIRDALKQDDRIAAVKNFVFDTSARHSILCEFTVETIFGEIQIEKVVNMNV